MYDGSRPTWTTNHATATSGSSELDHRLFYPEAEFFEPELQHVIPPEMESPPIAIHLAAAVASRHLLVIGGSRLVEKTLLAQHLAWFVIEQSRGSYRPGSIKQWHQGTSVQSLECLSRFPAGTLFIFADTMPHHLGHDLHRLTESLAARQHMAIITTELSRSEWISGGALAIDQYWCEPTTHDLFPSDRLARVLIDALQRDHETLPPWITPTSLVPDTVLLEGRTLRAVAEQLETPGRIHLFASQLAADPELSASAACELVADLADSDRAVERWFQRLDLRHRLLALGLAIFDGLFDDQVFAGLEVLVRSAWRALDPNMSCFDYRDLTLVAEYFPGTNHLVSRRIIECTSPQERRTILRLAWHLHRRYLLACLPVLARLAREASRSDKELAGDDVTPEAPAATAFGSPGAGPPTRHGQTLGTQHASNQASVLNDSEESRWQRHGASRDLHGSTLRAEQLRRAISERLSELGAMDRDAIEPTMLELARDGRVDAQLAAASAVARWRTTDPEDPGTTRFFETLTDWQTTTLDRNADQLSMGGVSNTAGFGAIRASVALAVSQASLLDPPNQLAEQLVELLTRLLDDPALEVQDRLANRVIPHIVASHTLQLNDLLWTKAVLIPRLQPAIGKGLALAAEQRPEEVLSLINRWTSKALELRAWTPEQHRECAFATLAYTYGFMPVADDRAPLSPEEVFARLRQILEYDTEPMVRHAVVHAVITQAGTCFDTAAPHMKPLFNKLFVDERAAAIEQLKDVYLRQREQLGPGESEIVMGGCCYAIWLTTLRPQTPLEALLATWLDDTSTPAIQQLTLRAFERFSRTRLEYQERQRIREYIEQQKARSPWETYRGKVRPTGPLFMLSLLVAFPSAGPTRHRLRALLPELVASHRSNTQDSERQNADATALTKLLLYRLKVLGTQDALATALLRSWRFFRARWVLVISLGIGALLCWRWWLNLWHVIVDLVT